LIERSAIGDARRMPFEHLRRNSNPVANLKRPIYGVS